MLAAVLTFIRSMVQGKEDLDAEREGLVKNMSKSNHRDSMIKASD